MLGWKKEGCEEEDEEEEKKGSVFMKSRFGAKEKRSWRTQNLACWRKVCVCEG